MQDKKYEPGSKLVIYIKDSDEELAKFIELIGLRSFRGFLNTLLLNNQENNDYIGEAIQGKELKAGDTARLSLSKQDSDLIDWLNNFSGTKDDFKAIVKEAVFKELLALKQTHPEEKFFEKTKTHEIEPPKQKIEKKTTLISSGMPITGIIAGEKDIQELEEEEMEDISIEKEEFTEESKEETLEELTEYEEEAGKGYFVEDDYSATYIKNQEEETDFSQHLDKIDDKPKSGQEIKDKNFYLNKFFKKKIKPEEELKEPEQKKQKIKDKDFYLNEFFKKDKKKPVDEKYLTMEEFQEINNQVNKELRKPEEIERIEQQEREYYLMKEKAEGKMA